MKKNVKYIGSAVAVALMASAPIVIPNLMPVNVIQAEDSGSTDQDTTPPTAEEQVEMFKSQFPESKYISSKEALKYLLIGNGNIKNSSLAGDADNNYMYFDPNKIKYLWDIQNNGYIDKLKEAKYTTSEAKADIKKKYFYDNGVYFNRDVMSYIQLSDKNKTYNLVSNGANLGDGIRNFAENELDSVQMPLKVTFYIESPDSYNVTTKSFSMNVDLSRININKDKSDETTVLAGTTIDNLPVGNNELTVTDDYTTDPSTSGNLGTLGKRYFGKSLFKTQEDALKYADEDDFDPDSTTAGATDAVDSNGGITPSGPYFQTVSYKLDSSGDAALNQALSNNTTNVHTGTTVSPYDTYINNGTNTATDGTDYVLNKKAGLITVVRQINVDGDVTPKFETPQVTVGTNESSLVPIDSNNNVLTYGTKGEQVATESPTTDGKYYTAPSTTSPASDDDINSDGEFLKAGKYYRKVVFKLKNGDVSNYNFTKSGTGYIFDSTNSTDNSVTYFQEVDVLNNVDANITKPTVGIGSSNNSKNITDGNTLTSNNESIVKDGTTPTSDSKYYLPGSSAKDIFDGDAKEVTGIVDSNGNFAQTGTYLHKITFDLKDDELDGNYFDPDTTYVDKTNNQVSYIQEVTISGNKAVVTFDTPEVNDGATSEDPALVSTSGDTLTNGNTSIVDTTKGTDGIDFGTDYYNDPQLTDKADKLSARTKPYYRKITFHVLPKYMETTDFNGTYGAVDSENNEVSFVQEIAVKSNNSSNNSGGNNSGSNTGTDDDWTYSDINGVVTTKTLHHYYTLNKDNNDVATDRALAANTGWVTDKMRVNKAGDVQYRVSTHEWIDASKVIWNKPVTSELTDVQDANGIAYLDGTSSSYSIYKSDLELITNRALAKNTAWKVDHVAKDAEGNIYYRVSTNEWLRQVNGVTFVPNK